MQQRALCPALESHAFPKRGLLTRARLSSALDYLRAHEPGITFVSLSSYDRSNLQSGDSVWLENRLLGGELSGHELMLFTLRDLTLLGEADVLVGHFAR